MADPRIAIERTMKFEDSTLSGKVTFDAGGRTRFGIAEKFHPDLPGDFFTGPKEEALAESERLMTEEYWALMHLDDVESQDIANKLFDMAVNMGVHQAVIYAQRAVNFLIQQGTQAVIDSPVTPVLRAAFTLLEDGKMGPKTIAAINTEDPAVFYGLLKQFSAAHYRHIAANNPSQAINLNGWLKRAEA
jgi:lysozyme family protein